MKTDNPFDNLGLKKSMVEYLVRTGQLEGFVRDFFRITQTRVHPDKGGDTSLSAVVNEAYSAIRQHPDKVQEWAAIMQNGNGNAEHIAVIEALVEKVEKLQDVERRYDELQRKYAELLAGGEGVEASVRKVRRTESPRTSSRAAPRVTPEDAEVRTPPRAGARTRRVEPREDPVPEVRLVEPILVEGIICVGSDGKVFEKHEKLMVDGDVIRNPRGFYSGLRIHKHVSFTTYNAIAHFESGKPGRYLLSLAGHCGLLEKVFNMAVKRRKTGSYETLDAKAKAVLDQFKNYGPGYGWHAVNGVIDGIGDRIIHYPHDSDFPEYGGTKEINSDRKSIIKPFRRGKDWSASKLEEALKDKDKIRFLKDATGRTDLRVLLDWADYFEREAWFYPPAEGGVWSAWLGCNGGKFYFSADSDLSSNDAARGVRRP